MPPHRSSESCPFVRGSIKSSNTDRSYASDMGRFRAPAATRGSQRWIQYLVNRQPEILESALGVAVDWRSPLERDDYAEYRDQACLDLLGIAGLTVPLLDFWPQRGPQWDALGLGDDGSVVLVEAKAHLAEMRSPPSQAKSPQSIALIDESLRSTAAWLSAVPSAPWSASYYQYTNRLAHAYFLQELNAISTRLVFMYFCGDADIRGPASAELWYPEIRRAHRMLGITELPSMVTDVFVDVQPLSAMTGDLLGDSGRSTPLRIRHVQVRHGRRPSASALDRVVTVTSA